MEDQVREAIIAELERQGDLPGSPVSVSRSGDRMTVSGEIDLDALAMAVVGSVAGGP